MTPKQNNPQQRVWTEDTNPLGRGQPYLSVALTKIGHSNILNLLQSTDSFLILRAHNPEGAALVRKKRNRNACVLEVSFKERKGDQSTTSRRVIRPYGTSIMSCACIHRAHTSHVNCQRPPLGVFRQDRRTYHLAIFWHWLA